MQKSITSFSLFFSIFFTISNCAYDSEKEESPIVRIDYTDSLIIISGHTPDHYGITVAPRSPNRDVCHILITSHHLKPEHDLTDSNAWEKQGSALLINLYNPFFSKKKIIPCYFKTPQTYALSAKKIIIDSDGGIVFLDINPHEYLIVEKAPQKSIPRATYAPLHLKPLWTFEEKMATAGVFCAIAGVLYLRSPLFDAIHQMAEDFFITVILEHFINFPTVQRALERHQWQYKPTVNKP